MAGDEMTRFELKFIREGGPSRRAKVKDFWLFVRNRDDVVPFQPFRGSTVGNSSSVQDKSCRTAGSDKSEVVANCNQKTVSGETSEKVDGSTSTMKRNIWYEQLCIFKQLGLDRAALAASNECKRCLADQRHTDREIRLADCLPETYGEFLEDMKASEKRIKNQQAKFVCRKPV